MASKKVAVNPPSTRAVIVVDRGWIFAGDVTRKNGRILLDRAVHVFGWKSIGFTRMLAEWNTPNVDLRPCPTQVDIPESAEIYCCPVDAAWGIKP